MGELEECHDKVDNLLNALDTRDVIGQAKGVLMERHDIDADDAFAMLVKMSQDQNRKLHDVAADITGESESAST
jgi:AmiR/NasT family two-component response regulator